MNNLHEYLKKIETQCMDFSKDLSTLSAEEQLEILKRSCKYLYPEDKVLEKLINSKKNKKPLTIKFGVDPTGTNLHLGHAVPLTLLNRLQRMGHKIIFLVGDFTAAIGDPTGKISLKKILSRKVIENNLKDYKKQASKFINFNKTDIQYNTSWLNELRLPEVIEIFNKINLSLSLNRTDFLQRMKDKTEMTHAELVYPIIMGFDSVVLNPDMEVGGEDQKDNFEMCRYMMKIKDLEPECVALTGIIEGIDGSGEKMSKSKNNFISITETPHKIFEQIFALSDKLIPSYFMWLTELDNETVSEIEKLLVNEEIDSIALKTILGKAIVARLYSKEESEKSFASYMKETFKNTPTKDVKITRGSIMNVCEMLSAATEYKFDEVCALKHSAAIAVFDTEGNFVEYLDEGTKDINDITPDTFYIKISNKIILRAIKR